MTSRRYKGLLLDFYGTLVKEDGDIIHRIADAIAERSTVTKNRRRILESWNFSELCSTSFGDSFQSQRALELQSLVRLLTEYGVELDAEELSAELFSYWRAPEAFPSTSGFLAEVEIPTCVVSNIDTADLLAAIDYNGWEFARVVTSEDCRSYKPRPELFMAGLKRLGLGPRDVLHVGDNLRVDVAGAADLGIDSVWVNRSNRPLPEAGLHSPTHVVADLEEVLKLLN